MVTTVRLATLADLDAVYAMLVELAAIEGGTVSASPADLARDGFGDRKLFEVLLAEESGAVAGMLVFFPTYSTWQGKPGVMIHDLFVREAARGRGIGESLVKELARLGEQSGWARMDVSVLEGNLAARRFYDCQGLTHDAGWVRHRGAEETLHLLRSPRNAEANAGAVAEHGLLDEE